jgi:prepilin-type N-terminal cleavage/methylation domain-containing protein
MLRPPLWPPRRPRAADAGFTLVELLISISVLGIVLTAITGVTFVAMRTTAGANTRLNESNDLLRAATYFDDDVQGAQAVSVGTTPRCGTDATSVVELAGQDFTDDNLFTITTTVVTYVVRTVTAPTGTTKELHRLACAAQTDAPAYPLTPVTDIPVVRQLSSSSPTVTCGGSPCSAFARVDMAVQERSGGLTYTLSGRRRVS